MSARVRLQMAAREAIRLELALVAGLMALAVAEINA
jgi:hypothetical protein